MTTPAPVRGLRTADEIRRAAREDERAEGPLTPQQAQRLATAFLPALTKLRGRQDQERDGVA